MYHITNERGVQDVQDRVEIREIFLQNQEKGIAIIWKMVYYKSTFAGSSFPGGEDHT